MTKKWLLGSVLMPSLLLAGSLTAAEITPAADEEIKQAITTASEAYQTGELSQAAGQLDYAATLIRQLQADHLSQLLPEPLPGWKAGKAESQAGAMGLLGGGIHRSRNYQKDDSHLEISIMKDSPLLQTMGMLFNNPSMAAMSGYKVKKMQGQTAMIKDEDGDQELTMMIENRILLQLEGSNISADDLKAYADAINIEAITKL